jgi:hypothetical protein
MEESIQDLCVPHGRVGTKFDYPAGIYTLPMLWQCNLRAVHLQSAPLGR